MQWLKQGTVAVIHFGPFLDKTDGVTLEDGAGIITSIDHATTGIKLSKNGGSLAVREQGANFVASIYDAHGFYKVSLSAIDTGTFGRLLVVHSEPATYLIVPKEFMVVPAQVWDSLFGADKLDVAVVEQANIDFGALQKTSLNAATPASVQNIPATGSGFTALGDTRLARLDVAVSTRTTLGAGPTPKTYTVRDSVTLLPIADVLVEVSLENPKVNTILSGRTNALGQVTFRPDVPAGTTLYMWRDKTGTNFINPDIEVMS